MRTFEIPKSFTILPSTLELIRFAPDLLHAIQESRVLFLPCSNVPGKNAEDPINQKQDTDAIKHKIQNPEYNGSSDAAGTEES